MNSTAKARLTQVPFHARPPRPLPFAISYLRLAVASALCYLRLAIGYFGCSGSALGPARPAPEPFGRYPRNTATVVALAAVLLLTACRAPSSPQTLHRFEFKHPAMGTLFTITLYAPNAPTAEAAADAAFKRIDALEDIMSDYQADSELMRLCDQPYGKPVPVSADLFDVLQRAQRISQLSDGSFDATIGPCVRLWRFARKRKVLPTPAEIATAQAAVGWQKLRLDSHTRTVTLLVPNMRLDLGGIGKGYAADAAMQILKGRGLTRALVAASGDIAAGDPPPGQPGWKVGIATLGTRTNQLARTIILHNAGDLHVRRQRAVH